MPLLSVFNCVLLIIVVVNINFHRYSIIVLNALCFVIPGFLRNVNSLCTNPLIHHLPVKRAVSENRTHDLFPTKEVLYH